MVDWVRRNTVTQRNSLISQNSVFRRPWFGITVFCSVMPAAKPTYSCCVLFKYLEELFILSAIESINLLSFKISEKGLSL